MNNKNSVSCIIPAYNESRTITGIVKTSLQTPEIKEVIVVNDGSSDNTLAKLKPFQKKIKIINLLKNHGKGYAVAQGIKEAQHPLLLFLDADLRNLKPHHLFSLIQPVADNRADMTIGYFVSTSTPLYLSSQIWWRFSGQRCLKKRDVVSLIKDFQKAHYGLEIILNERFKKKRIVTVPLIVYGKFHIIKPDKQSDWLIGYAREVWSIFQQTISIKSQVARRRIKSEFLHSLASYLKISYSKLKRYLTEETEI